MIYGRAGWADLIGREQGRPEFAPTLLADKTAGLATANVLAAMVHQARTGEGQHVEVPMFETMAAFTLTEHLGGLTFDPPQGGGGYARLLTGGRKPVPTRDGFVAMLPYTTDHWAAFFTGVGRDDLARKYDLQDRHQAQCTHPRALCRHARGHARVERQRSAGTVRAAGHPGHPDLVHRSSAAAPAGQGVGLLQKVHHPTEGPIWALRPPPRFARTPAELASPAPTLGQHTEEVLREAGFDDGDLAALAGCGAIRRG